MKIVRKYKSKKKSSEQIKVFKIFWWSFESWILKQLIPEFLIIKFTFGAKIMSGKRDRPAHFNNDDQEEDKQVTQKTEDQSKADEKEIAERKYFNVDLRIFKIKSPFGGEKEVTESKPKFTLFDNTNIPNP